MAEAITYADSVEVYEAPPELSSTVERRLFKLNPAAMWAPPVDESGTKRKRSTSDDPYLIIGFDTEFKTPESLMTRDQIAAGEAKYRVLSYQFHAKTSDGREWQGICCPEGDERLSLGAFLVFALASGCEDHGIDAIPPKIYLVGHFTRADIPAFDDFDELCRSISSVRNTFISIDQTTRVEIEHDDGSRTALKVLFRDTLLLTPQAARSLKEIGELVGLPKLTLDDDPARHREMIRNMDRVRAEHWDVFKRYALNDASICVRYIETIIDQYEDVTGRRKVPGTLTSIGVDLLLKSWKETAGLDPLNVLGKEVVVEQQWDALKQRMKKVKREVNLEEVEWRIGFVTECYHGGRNEQFWFGPAFEDDWSDFDLSSAYPTAMSLIGLPDWRSTREELHLETFQATTLGFACVEFEFPDSVRFPTLPVRTSNGLVFPKRGVSYCAAPELILAQRLGAKLRIKQGVIVPTDRSRLIFGDFIKECLARRKEAGQKTLRGLFWKEISNSTYGKTAQGLREKRVYDMANRKMRDLPESRITNPFFAAYITSFTRAVLGEVINSLAPTTCLFSCTTDGFLTNAGLSEVERAQQGELGKLFAAARQRLTGTANVLEKKHEIRRPLGWRTRGQATLAPGDIAGKDDSYNVLLAKGGLFLRPEFEGVAEQNEEVVRLFFARTPEAILRVETMTGVRDIVERNADLVEKVFEKRLNMEFDWKRKPLTAIDSAADGHVCFSTTPWNTVEEFRLVREAQLSFADAGGGCIKSTGDLERFLRHTQLYFFQSQEGGRYLSRSDDADLKRLRQMLCLAWRHSVAGLVWQSNRMSAAKFAALLTQHGIPCKKTDVENARKKEFLPNTCPPTARVHRLLKSLKSAFPNLQTEMFAMRSINGQELDLSLRADCPLINRMSTARSVGLLGDLPPTVVPVGHGTLRRQSGTLDERGHDDLLRQFADG